MKEEKEFNNEAISKGELKLGLDAALNALGDIIETAEKCGYKNETNIGDFISSLSARIAELEKDNARLREVLKIYANESRWVAISPTGDERVFTHNGNGYDLAKLSLENSEAAKGERK